LYSLLEVFKITMLYTVQKAVSLGRYCTWNGQVSRQCKAQNKMYIRVDYNTQIRSRSEYKKQPPGFLGYILEFSQQHQQHQPSLLGSLVLSTLCCWFKRHTRAFYVSERLKRKHKLSFIPVSLLINKISTTYITLQLP